MSVVAACVEQLETRRLLTTPPQPVIDLFDSLYDDGNQRLSDAPAQAMSKASQVLSQTLSPARDALTDAISDLQGKTTYLPSFTPPDFIQDCNVAVAAGAAKAGTAFPSFNLPNVFDVPPVLLWILQSRGQAI